MKNLAVIFAFFYIFKTAFCQPLINVGQAGLVGSNINNIQAFGVPEVASAQLQTNDGQAGQINGNLYNIQAFTPEVELPAGAMYGGSGTGEIAVSGDVQASGQTVVTGSVPVIGTVHFTGTIPASGFVSIAGKCDCGASAR